MTHTTFLPENRLSVKRYAVKPVVGQFRAMPSQRQKKPKTVLQAIFIKRVKEEMGELSGNELSKRPGGPPQTTFNDVLNGADPRLETVHQIATALNIPAWHLFLEKSDLVRLRTETPNNVREFPALPRMLGEENQKSVRKARDRKIRAR